MADLAQKTVEDYDAVAEADSGTAGEEHADPSSKEKKPKQRKYRSDRGAFLAAFMDLFVGLVSVRLWWSLACEEFIRRYSRTALGAIWSMASFVVWILAISFFFGALSSAEASAFTHYVALGFLVFSYISSSINEGCSTFVSSRQWMQSARLPLSIYVFKDTARGLITFFFNAIGAAGVLLVFGFRPEGITSLWALAGLAILPINAVWVGLLFGTISARYRDFLHLMQTVMRLAFFMTPVMWRAEDLGTRGVIAEFNPMTHFLNIVRDPMLYQDPNWHSWKVVLVITGVGWLIALAAFIRSRNRIVFWI